MRIVIFHYHLNPGGVTSVILAQVKALQAEHEITILTGSCDNVLVEQLRHVRIVVSKSLNYRSDSIFNYNEEIECVKSLIKQNCQRSDILHAHNINLGKNPLITIAVSQLAKEGYRVVNHIHDFAEDRPENMHFLQNCIENDLKLNLKKILYPNLPNYHFVVLNSNDKKRIRDERVERSRIHRIPNPAAVPETLPMLVPEFERRKVCSELGLDKAKKIVTYPVRVIQRKNIGEFILLACLFEKEANWIVTQPPKNPSEIKVYEQWKNFCATENIKIYWEAGTRTSFTSLLSVSDYCITTSFREGFGLAFIEPWLYNTPVVGRDIPEVTLDLVKSGLEFPCLYSRLEVDGKSEMHELVISEQMNIIRKCKTDELFRKNVLDQNVALHKLMNPVDNSLIKRNIDIILREYSPEKFGKRLYEIYRAITG
jgi:glycosyltransferase involved in cell wall biosynthesis